MEEGLRLRLLDRERKASNGDVSMARESSPPAGVVVYLLMENAQRTVHRDLLLSLKCLGRFFAKYPVVIFHTNASTPIEMQRIREAAAPELSLVFEEVQLGFPDSLLQMPGGPDAFFAPPRCLLDGRHMWESQRSCGCRCPASWPQCWPLNWMHATRFFTAGMFRTHTFQDGNFDFFLRLDTDLFFVQEPTVDPFRLMSVRGCVMVYDQISLETPGCHDDFDEHTIRFFERSGYRGEPDFEIMQIGHSPGAVGGQWTVGDIRVFSSPSYLRFADFFSGGIYAHRWADQILLLRGAGLFGPKSRADWGSARHEAAPSVCLEPVFPGGSGNGFVHQKGGYRDETLLLTCGVKGSLADNV